MTSFDLKDSNHNFIMFSDADIRRELQQNNGISIEPFEEDSLTPVGYDLRVGDYGFSLKNKRRIKINQDGQLRFKPNDTIIIETYESIRLSNQFAATIHSSASLASLGLSHISTTVDPGWSGKLLISVHNYSDRVIVIEFKERFCTVCFYRVQNPAVKPHGRDPGRGDIKSRLAQEEEKNKKIYMSRSFWLITLPLIFIFATVLSYLLLGKELAAIVISILTAISVFLVEIFKNK